jgi:hypothetical protein
MTQLDDTIEEAYALRQAGRRLRSMLSIFHDVDRAKCRRPCDACEAIEQWERIDPL